MGFGTMIVGLGKIGMGYDLHLDPDSRVYSHARAFSRHPDFRLIGAVDPDKKKRDDCARIYQCPTFDSIEATGGQKPDVVVIAAPTPSHGESLRRVLSRGRPRAILCEKPLSYDLDEARDMVRSCADSGIELYVNYMRRSDPGALEVKRRLDAGEIATPLKGVAWYSKGFQHNGSHFMNLLEYWLGPMKDAQVLAPGRLYEGVDPEPDARVVFERGEVVFLAAREENFPHYAIELLAPNGRLRYDRGGELIQWQAAKGSLSAESETIASGMDRYQWNVAEQLAKALDGKDARLCSGAQALKTLESVKEILARR